MGVFVVFDLVQGASAGFPKCSFRPDAKIGHDPPKSPVTMSRNTRLAG
jgi:hypothetical protein